jgi:NADH-quinone oxidoreductase subunit L
MFRQLFLVFHGECRAAEPVKARIHESSRVMTVPLVVLAAGSIFAGWLGSPDFMWGSAWNHWLEPLFGAAETGRHDEQSVEILFLLLTLAVAGAGFYLAYLSYMRGARLPESLSSWGGGSPYRCLFHKYYVDEFYDLAVVRPFTSFSGWLARVFDLKVIDAIVNGVADRVRGSSFFWRELQTGNVQHYLLGFLTGTLALFAYYLYR